MSQEKFAAFATKRAATLPERMGMAQALENDHVLNQVAADAGDPQVDEDGLDDQMKKSAEAFAQFQNELLAETEDGTSW